MKKTTMACAGLVAMAAFAQTETHSDLGWAGDADFWNTSSRALITTDVQRTAVAESVEFRTFFEDFYILPDIFSTFKRGLLVSIR